MVKGKIIAAMILVIMASVGWKSLGVVGTAHSEDIEVANVGVIEDQESLEDIRVYEVESVAERATEPILEDMEEDIVSSVTEVVNGRMYVNGILIVNKGYGLPENYSPGESVEAREAYEAFRREAANKGHRIREFSTYRSYEYQRKLYERYVKKDGQEKTDTYSARAGHSEHQTGLAFDIGWDGMKMKEAMGETATGVWVHENAHRFGFILRYPRGKEEVTGYQYEPWHFRYLGLEVATAVYDSGLTLDEYSGKVEPEYR